MIPPDLLITADLPRPPHAVDAYLRDAGFNIVSRPKKGETVWGRKDRTYTDGEAFTIAFREEPARKKRQEAARNLADAAERKGKSGGPGTYRD